MCEQVIVMCVLTYKAALKEYRKVTSCARCYPWCCMTLTLHYELSRACPCTWSASIGHAHQPSKLHHTHQWRSLQQCDQACEALERAARWPPAQIQAWRPAPQHLGWPGRQGAGNAGAPWCPTSCRTHAGGGTAKQRAGSRLHSRGAPHWSR